MLSFEQFNRNFDYLVSTDGACKGNPGPGTWAFVVFDPATDNMLGHKKGHKATTTNNKMEMKAILEALKWANSHKKSIKILTDSNYCLKGITEWRNGWERRGWKNAKGEPVANKGTWVALFAAWDAGSHELEKVKGHSGNRYNEAADMYCNEEYINKFM
jgi:ribonuclease HI